MKENRIIGKEKMLLKTKKGAKNVWGTAGTKCPVDSEKLYLWKLTPKAKFLFSRFSKEALNSPTA